MQHNSDKLFEGDCIVSRQVSKLDHVLEFLLSKALARRSTVKLFTYFIKFFGCEVAFVGRVENSVSFKQFILALSVF